MNYRKLLSVIGIVTLTLAGVWVTLAGLVRPVQAAPALPGVVEWSGMAIPSASPPTSTLLSPSDIDEGLTAGATVGTLSTTDSDLPPQTFTYAFTDTASFPDNDDFTITGDTLTADNSLDFETKSSYSIKVVTADSGGDSIETPFTITVNNVNEAPTDLSLSNTSVNENQGTNAVVGALSTVDPDNPGASQTHSYTLVTGSGSADNASFNISGNQLRTSVDFNFEVKSSYNIRIRTTDNGASPANLTWEEPFTITVNDVNETPTNINLSNSSVAENQSSGTTVGIFSAIDPDTTGSYTFTLVGGTGSTDNGSFDITGGNTLVTDATFDFEVKNSYSIRVRVTDNGGLTFEKQFTITVTNVNEAPTDLSLNNTSVNENQSANTVVGTLSTVDPDNPGAGQTHTYTLVSGSGSANNGLFNISGNQLRTSAVFDYQAKNSYNIRIRTTDNGASPANLTWEEPFTITVNDLFPDFSISKTANVASVPETGANVTFTIRVTNTSQENGNLIFFFDTDFDLDTRCPGWSNQLINKGQVFSCSYSAFISGDFGGPNHSNTAQAQLEDNENHQTIIKSSTRTVSFTDVLPDISVTVSANPNEIVEPGGNIVYSVLVTNAGTEIARLNSLTDTIYGNLNGQGTCVANGTGTIAAGGTYSCSFTKPIAGSPGTNIVNKVTATVADDDGNSKSANDDTTVIIKPILYTYVPTVLKDYIAPTELSIFNDNTGGDVTFSVLGTSVSCTVPNNTTLFCGSFPAGTYNVHVVSTCGPPATAPKVYPAGLQTTRIFCLPN